MTWTGSCASDVMPQPDVDHLLRSQPGRSNPKKYREQLDSDVDPGVKSQLRDWLAEIELSVIAADA